MSNRNGVKSIEIGFSILDVLVNHGQPMKLKDIATQMQMPPAKIHRYLVSMIVKDYVAQLSNGNYTLGGRIDIIRQQSPSKEDIMDRLQGMAEALQQSLHCGVQFAKWFSEGPIVIESLDPNKLISLNTRVGSRMPIIASATGRLLASYQPLESIKPLVLDEMQGMPAKHIQVYVADGDIHSNSNIEHEHNPEGLEQQWQQFAHSLADIRKQGYTYVVGDIMTGVNAFSLAVNMPATSTTSSLDLNLDVDIDSQLATEQPLAKQSGNQGYAITVVGTAEQLPASKKKRIINQMQALAQRYKLL